MKPKFLTKEKDLLVYRGQDELEATITISPGKGLILSVNWDGNGDVEVRVMKTVDGCPGVGKPEFYKLYRK